MDPERMGSDDTQPLLESMQMLLQRERALAALQLEDKEKSLQEWRTRFLELQEEVVGGGSPHQELDELAEELSMGAEPRVDDQEGDVGDWGTLKVARKARGDTPFLQLRSQKNLNLSHEGIGTDELQSVLAKLRWLRHLTSLDLSHNQLAEDAARWVGEMACLKLKVIDLSYNWLGGDGGRAVLHGVGKNRVLEELRIEGNMPMGAVAGFGSEVVQALRVAFKSGACSKLISFGITLDDYSATGGRRRSDKPAAKSGPGRATNPLNANAFVKLFSTRGTIPLKQLTLAHAKLHPRTVAELAVHALRCLTLLDLSNSFIGAPGAVQLGKGLGAKERSKAGHCTLATLLLRHNAVGNAGAQALAKALGTNTSLTHLDLTSNVIGDEGAVAMGKQVGMSKKLCVLGLGDNPMSAEGVKAVLNAISKRAGALQVDGFDRLQVPISVREALKRDPDPVESSVAIGQEPLMVHPEEVVQSAKTPNADGFVQMYRKQLITLGEAEATGTIVMKWGCTRTKGRGGRASNEAPPYLWRVTRRDGHAVTVVKEGCSLVRLKDGRLGPSPDAVQVNGFDIITAASSGWCAGDDLVLSVAPCDGAGNCLPPSLREAGVGGKLRCKGLKISAAADMDYGIIYRDAIGYGNSLCPNGGIKGKEEWYTVNEELQKRAGGATAPKGQLHCLREVYVGFKGALKAVWEGQLVQTEAAGSQGSERNGQQRVIKQFIKGYTWAVARKRVSHNDVAVRVVELGTVRLGVTGSDVVSPWKALRCDALLKDCLPSDVLSLWIRVDLHPGASSYTDVQRRTILEGVQPCAQDFKLYHVDAGGDRLDKGSFGGQASAMDAPTSAGVALQFYGPNCMDMAALKAKWR